MPSPALPRSRLGAPPSGCSRLAASSVVPLLGFALACGAPAALPTSLYPIPGADDDGCAPAVAAIASVDEPTPLGFSALDALTHLAGPRSSPLEWHEPTPSDEYELALGPERGSSTLELDLRLREGIVLHRFRSPLLTSPEDTACDPGALEIPVAVTLQSGAQGLAESFDAVLEVRTPHRGHVSARLEPSALRGSLGVTRVLSLDPARSFWLAAVRVEADIWAGGSAGALSMEIGASHAKAPRELIAAPAAPLQPGPVAAWPSALDCGDEGTALPADAKVLGFSVADVIEELRQSGTRELPVAWSDGGDAPLLLEIAADAAELCQAVGDTLSFTAMLRARSDGGGLDVRSPVRIEAWDAGGRVGAIRIESSDPDSPYPVTSAASSTGTSSEGYAAVLVGLEWTHEGASDSGSLSLRGVEATTPDASGVYPSTALANARW